MSIAELEPVVDPVVKIRKNWLSESQQRTERAIARQRRVAEMAEENRERELREKAEQLSITRPSPEREPMGQRARSRRNFGRR